ncbi:MAG: hypothetical protein Q8N90_02580 [bacterium]|nr:hypothetical protein [bacterium]
MNDLLRYVRVKAVWENVPKPILAVVSEWIVKNQLQKQVQVGEAKSKIFLACELGPEPEQELIPDVPVPLPNLPNPNWFQIRISEAEFKGPAIAVVDPMGKSTGGFYIRELENGERMRFHFFQQGTVVRHWKVRGGNKVDASELSVCQRSGRYYLIVSPLLDVFVRDYKSSDDLEGFFRFGQVPENLQGIIAEMVGIRPSGGTFNPVWDGALAELHKKQEVVEPIKDSDSKPDSGRPRSHNKERRRTEGHKPRPEVLEEVPCVKAGASLQDVQEEAED